MFHHISGPIMKMLGQSDYFPSGAAISVVICRVRLYIVLNQPSVIALQLV